jgi:LIM domain.
MPAQYGQTAQQPKQLFASEGRYAIAGSENPTISLAPPTQIDPICSICGKDMTETSDFFVENGKVYCPKCYANKRWKEVKDKKQWLQSIKAWRKIAKDEEFNRAKTHTPDDAESEVS